MKTLLEYLISKENKKKISKRKHLVSEYSDKIEEYLSKNGMYGVLSKITGSINVYPKGKKSSIKNLLFAINSVDYIDWGTNDNLKRRYEQDLLNIMNNS